MRRLSTLLERRAVYVCSTIGSFRSNSVEVIPTPTP